MNLANIKWQEGKKAAINSFALLFPGLLSALFIFYISSNRLFANNRDLTIFLLNFLQIYMLGITIVKYGIDQILLSRLQPGNRMILFDFYKSRVLPLTLIFVIVAWIMKGWLSAVFLLVMLPLEIMLIIVSVELNVSERFGASALLKLLGYPFFFILIYLANVLGHVSPKTVLSLFFISTIIRLVISLFIRNNGPKADVAILSYQVPIQQVGNFFLFRFDQVVIALALGFSFFTDQANIGYYLFFAKFPEAVGGVIVALAPLIYKRFEKKLSISMFSLFRDKVFLLFSLALCFTQLIISLTVFKPVNIENNFLLFIPFVFSSLLTLPVSLIIYLLLKNGELHKINVLNALSILMGLLILALSVFSNNINLYSLLIPVQLFTYIIMYNLLYKKAVI